MSTSRALARNTLLNVAGQVIPMLAALIAIPILIDHLGVPRFGVLTLAWAAIGYFNLFDLGLGRALTQAIAVRLGVPGSTRELTSIAWTALALMLMLGVAGGGLLALVAPWLVQHGLNVPDALVVETITVLYLLAASLPLLLTTAGLRGLLEAHQDFGAATALRIPLALFTFIAPLAVIPFSTGLVPIVVVLVVGRAVTWLGHVAVCMHRYSYLRRGFAVRRQVVLPLLRFGGWMTVSNVVSPIMAYLDRFFIGAILPLSAVAYYVTPYELVTKALLLPQATVMAAFPAFAATWAQDPGRTSRLFERTLRAVLLAMFPLLLVVVLFAREGLTLWVGAELASRSTLVLQWLAIGVFLNGVAQTPFVVLQSTGRPDLTAKLHLAELPLYLAALWVLAHRFGIAGVAMAWTLRSAIDLVALLVLSSRRLHGGSHPVRAASWAAAGSVLVLGMSTYVQGGANKLVFLALTLVLFAFFGWTRVVQPDERTQLRVWARGRRGAVAPPA